MICPAPCHSKSLSTKNFTSPEEKLREVSDRQLLFQIQLATRGERTMTIKILRRLNEIERRKLYLELGYSSLFDYCTRSLKYSASAAGRRIQTARAIRRYPEILDLFRTRELSLSTISLVASILTDANKDTILDRVRGKSHREVESVVSEYRPPVSLRDRIKPVKVRVPRPADADRLLFERELARLAPNAAAAATPGAGSATVSVGVEQKLFVQFLADEELMEKFEEARALLFHRFADVSFGDVLHIILTEFLQRRSPKARHKKREERKATGTAKRPSARASRASAEKNHSRRRECKTPRANGKKSVRGAAKGSRRDVSKGSRYIPQAVRDEVFARNGGECAYVTRDGTRCCSTRSLQIDHIRPFAAEGSHELSNLRLLCAKHNRLAAEQALGKHVMKPYWRKE